MAKNVIWDPKKETMSRDEIHEIQSRELRNVTKRVYDNVPFYRQKMDAIGVKPEDIQEAEDIQKLPFTEKSDLRDNYPFGLFAVPREQIVRVHASSGTTGKPTVAGYTQQDLDTWADLMARSMSCAGITKDSVVHVAYGYGLFTGGLGAHYGAERIGATVVPASGGNTQRQLMLIRDFGATALACTPSYAMNLADAMEKNGMDMSEIKLEAGVFGAEPWSEHMRDQLEKRLHIRAHDVYGLTEMMGPGVAMDCVERNGLHVWEDHFLPEIIDEDLKGVPYGTEGELVITTLTKQGMPLLRYRTHDISSLDIRPCACGRTHVRMKRVKARTDDMLIIRGVNVFPSQIEHSLLKIQGIAPQYQIVVDRKGSLDTIEVQVELDRTLIGDTVRDLEALSARIAAQLASDVLISCQVKLCQPGSLPRSEGKAKRVIDNRK
ncbi:MAG: phenylacetate--CoA ligase [Clostridia bacterium]|nr:phenylacetate--CoA ligase [Clostridia bacterium]